MNRLRVDVADSSATGAEDLSAALLELEDGVVVDAATGYATAADLERRASALGDDALIMRARLCRIDMLRRTGDVARAARQIKGIHAWARDHRDRRLRARTHLVWANIERLSGNAAKFLAHARSAVDSLDATATPSMQIWHRTRLADALADNGDMTEARLYFCQAEELARELQEWERLRMLLNNWAYSEYEAGDFLRAREVARRMHEHAAAHSYDLDPGALDTIGTIQIANGEYSEAEQTMQACIARYKAGGDNDADEMAHYLLTLARAQRGLGATGQAQASLHAAQIRCVERDLKEVLARVHQEQAELHAVRGEHADAIAANKAAIAARESLRSPQRTPGRVILQAMFGPR